MSDCTICGSEMHLESNCDSADAIKDRVTYIYEFLVDETENRNTVISEKRSSALHLLLGVFEYLQGRSEDNPIEDLFS